MAPQEGQPISVEQTNTQEAVQTTVEAEREQTPAEKEYFRNLSNRILAKGALYIIGTPIGSATVGSALEHNNPNIDLTKYVLTGLFIGAYVTAGQIWRLRDERFPKNQLLKTTKTNPTSFPAR